MINALALDGHGVVYRRKQEVVDALVKTLETQGLIFSEQQARSIYLALQERTFAGELSYEAMVQELHRQLRLGSRLTSTKLHELIQKCSAEIEVDPDLTYTVGMLRERGVRVGMLTNSIHPAAVKEAWLRRAGIAHLFDLIVSSVEEHCKKPNPEIFQRFAERLRLRPDQVAFVGHDAQEIRGARLAGLVTVALACSPAPADFHIGRLGELLNLPIWPGKKEV